MPQVWAPKKKKTNKQEEILLGISTNISTLFLLNPINALFCTPKIYITNHYSDCNDQNISL